MRCTVTFHADKLGDSLTCLSYLQFDIQLDSIQLLFNENNIFKFVSLRVIIIIVVCTYSYIPSSNLLFCGYEILAGEILSSVKS